MGFSANDIVVGFRAEGVAQVVDGVNRVQQAVGGLGQAGGGGLTEGINRAGESTVRLNEHLGVTGRQSWYAARAGHHFAEGMVKSVIPVGALGDKMFMVERMMAMMDYRGEGFASMLKSTLIAAAPMAVAIGAAGYAVTHLVGEMKKVGGEGAAELENAGQASGNFFINFAVGQGWIDVATTKLEKFAAVAARLDKSFDFNKMLVTRGFEHQTGTDTLGRHISEREQDIERSRTTFRSLITEQATDIETQRGNIKNLSATKLAEEWAAKTGQDLNSAKNRYIIANINNPLTFGKVRANLEEQLNDALVAEQRALQQKAAQGDRAAIGKLRSARVKEAKSLLASPERMTYASAEDKSEAYDLTHPELSLAERMKHRVKTKVETETPLAELKENFQADIGQRMDGEARFQQWLRKEGLTTESLIYESETRRDEARLERQRDYWAAESNELEAQEKAAAITGNPNLKAQATRAAMASFKIEEWETMSPEEQDAEIDKRQNPLDRQRKIDLNKASGAMPDFLAELTAQKLGGKPASEMEYAKAQASVMKQARLLNNRAQGIYSAEQQSRSAWVNELGSAREGKGRLAEMSEANSDEGYRQRYEAAAGGEQAALLTQQLEQQVNMNESLAEIANAMRNKNGGFDVNAGGGLN